jgi:antirestriction protein ArdC
MNERVKNVLSTIVEKFKSGEIPEAVAMASFPIPDIPSGRWSFTNRTLMFLAGTADARGFRQWKKANRWVKKGARAIYILVPCMKKETDENTGEEKESLRFFKASPVFMCEDTDGEPLDYQQVELPQLPLIKRAEEWGISVKAVPGNYLYRGYFSSSRREIALATPEEKTFFHELAHAGHEKIKGGLTEGQDPLQEIVAELSAQALCRLVGKQAADSTGNSYRYIERYAKKLKLGPHSACLRVLGETEKVLNLILKGESA